MPQQEATELVWALAAVARAGWSPLEVPAGYPQPAPKKSRLLSPASAHPVCCLGHWLDSRIFSQYTDYSVDYARSGSEVGSNVRMRMQKDLSRRRRTCEGSSGSGFRATGVGVKVGIRVGTTDIDWKVAVGMGSV